MNQPSKSAEAPRLRTPILYKHPHAPEGPASDEHLYYLEGSHLLGDDGEGTVDGSHPTDLGFARQAAAFAKVLEPILTPMAK